QHKLKGLDIDDELTSPLNLEVRKIITDKANQAIADAQISELSIKTLTLNDLPEEVKGVLPLITGVISGIVLGLNGDTLYNTLINGTELDTEYLGLSLVALLGCVSVSRSLDSYFLN